MEGSKALPCEDLIHNVAMPDPHSRGNERLPLGVRPGVPENAVIEVVCTGELFTSAAAGLNTF